MENGKYLAIATKGELGTTSTGKEQIAVTFDFVDAAHAGKSMTWFGYFTEKTEQRTFETLRTCGFKGTDLTDLSSLSGETPTVELVVEAEEYNGEWRPKVKWVNNIGGGSLKSPLVGDQAKSFAARMAAKMKAFDATAGKSAAPAPKAPAAKAAPARPSARPPVRDELPPPGDDDIPF
jgi:hypothetical protein